ncbi:MAG: hypothetical protein ACR2RB_01450 [Gammaproteobacteria bacterium]
MMFLIEVGKAFRKHRVRYAVIGGYAVALHGATRGTIDVDVVIARNRGAYVRAEQALTELGLECSLPVRAGEIFDFREEYIRNRNLKAWSFVNPHNPVQLVDILLTVDLNEIDTVNKKVAGANVQVASAADLIRMKKASGRDQDIEDIKALEKLI